MVRIIGYALLGGIVTLIIGLVIGAGQYVGSGPFGFIIVIAIGAITGAVIASVLNKKSRV